MLPQSLLQSRDYVTQAISLELILLNNGHYCVLHYTKPKDSYCTVMGPHSGSPPNKLRYIALSENDIFQ